MVKLKIAVLGASSIGKFHVREFARAGTDVTAILGSSKETADNTAQALSLSYGVHPRAYTELDRLIEIEQLDAVSICTPARMHYDQVKKCLTAGLHVLCEKPLVLNSYAKNSPWAKELIALSKKQHKILSVNTQWPSILEYIKNHVDLSTLKSFSMHMQPATRGIDMLPEQLPHTGSMVVKLIPNGHAEDITFLKHSPEDIAINFKYSNENVACDIRYTFTHKESRPRKVIFSFDGMEFQREIGEQYRQRLVIDTAAFDIEDPFKISIGKFVGAIEGKNSPMVNTKEIIENVTLQDRIIEAYLQKWPSDPQSRDNSVRMRDV